MPSYDDLSPEDQGKIDDLLTHVRPAAGTFAQSANTAKLIGQSGDVTGSVSLIDSLDSGTIPNRTGLAEAQALEPSQARRSGVGGCDLWHTGEVCAADCGMRRQRNYTGSLGHADQGDFCHVHRAA